MEKSEGNLMHLGFVRVVTVNACRSNIKSLRENAKENSGPLKSTVGTVENAGEGLVVRPVYDKFKDVPDEGPRFSRQKVQKASHVAQDLIQEAKVAGPRAAIYHAGTMSKQFGLLTGLRSITSWVKAMKAKGYDIFYMCLGSREEISKAYKQVEGSCSKEGKMTSLHLVRLNL
nr:REF/SRPP-like protein At1g67360 [Ipomoea batatas]